MSRKFKRDRKGLVSAATILSSALALMLGVGLAPSSASAAGSVATLQSAATSTTRLSGFDNAAASVRLGGQLTDSVRVLPQATRMVSVQFRRAGTTRFTTAYKRATSAQGAFTAYLMPKAAGTWQFRLVVAASPGATALTSHMRTVKASGHAVPTKVLGFSTARTTITVGQTVRDAISLSPRGSRVIEVQVRRPGTNFMATSTSGRSTTAGNFTAVYRPMMGGTFQYRLVVKASTGARTAVSATRTVTAVVTAPTAALSATSDASNPAKPMPGAYFSFEAAGSHAITGKTLTSGSLNYGDGSPVDAFSGTTWSSGHAFTTAGTKTVTLTVTDSAGLKSTKTMKIVIFPALSLTPTVGITKSGTVTVGTPVVFTLTASTPVGTAFTSWALSDNVTNGYGWTGGNGRPPASVTHVFTAAGLYEVTFGVNNDAGLTAQRMTIVVAN